MYVEISPRQSGKSSRLIEAVIDYLRNNCGNKVAIVTPNIARGKNLKEKIGRLFFNTLSQNFVGSDDNFKLLINDHYLGSIILTTDVRPTFGSNIDYYFFDDFSSMEPQKILLNNNIITNGYYCTTPCQKKSTINMITNHCLNNNINIKFFNPWTEVRLREQEGFEIYTREYVLNEWASYMETIGINVLGPEENWILKWVKKHSFV